MFGGRKADDYKIARRTNKTQRLNFHQGACDGLVHCLIHPIGNGGRLQLLERKAQKLTGADGAEAEGSPVTRLQSSTRAGRTGGRRPAPGLELPRGTGSAPRPPPAGTSPCAGTGPAASAGLPRSCGCMPPTLRSPSCGGRERETRSFSCTDKGTLQISLTRFRQKQNILQLC